MCSHAETYSQCQIQYCYTSGLLCAGRDILVSRNSLTRYTAWHLRIRRLVQFIFVGAVYHNALTNCAALLCRACVDLTVCVAVRYLTLRTGCERHGRKNPLPFPYFRAVTYRQSAPDYPRERQEFKEEGKPQVSLPFCPRRGRGSLSRSAERSSFAELQRKTLRPLGRTCLRSSCAPVNRCRKRVPPRLGEPPERFVHPVKRAPCKSKFPKENPHAIG